MEARDGLTALRSDAVAFFPESLLARVSAELSQGTTTARTIARTPTLHYVEARRVADGVPEIHDHWTDVTIVQAGRATLLAGGRADGTQLAADGEHRGGSITGGVARPIARGDFFVIPAGVPHQYRVARGDSVVYLTVKVRADGGATRK